MRKNYSSVIFIFRLLGQTDWSRYCSRRLLCRSVPGHNGATHRYQHIATLIQGSAAATETDDNYHTACGYYEVGQTM